MARHVVAQSAEKTGAISQPGNQGHASGHSDCGRSVGKDEIQKMRDSSVFNVNRILHRATAVRKSLKAAGFEKSTDPNLRRRGR